MVDDNYDDTVRRKMTELTRTFAAGASIDAVLTTVTTDAVEAIIGVDAADVVMVEDGQCCSLAATSDWGPRLSAVQQDTGQDPGLDVIRGRTAVRCDDLRLESPWPHIARGATAIGVHSVMSFRLETALGAVAALNFFGGKSHVFGVEWDFAMFAAPATNALIADDRRTPFASGLANRDPIGQAKGMLMKRFDVDAGQAFDILRRFRNTPICRWRTSPTG
jgi:hypothetical protein